MAHARYVCAVLVLFGASLRADEPEPAATTSATSLNQSLAIEEPAPPVAPTDEAAMVLGQATQSPSSDPRPAVQERPPILLGKKRIPSEAGPLGSEAAAPWYRSSIGAMAIVLGLIVVLFLVLRRWSPALKTSGSGIVQVLGRTALGPRQSLVLVQLGQRLVLVGVSSDRMERICEVQDAAEVSTLLAENRRARGDFSTWLDRESAEFAKLGGDESGEGQAGDGSSGHLAQLLRKLRTIKV